MYTESIYFGFGVGVGLGEYCSVCLITGSDDTVGRRPARFPIEATRVGTAKGICVMLKEGDII